MDLENARPAVETFNRELLAGRQCGDCPMRGRGAFVGLDTASGLVEPVDALLLGLNPGAEEAKIGRPFVGPSGRFLRAQLEQAGLASWGMANSLLCSSPNETAIVGADAARAACHGNLAVIYRALRPKIILPCGNGAWSIFKAGIPITQAAEKYFISRGPHGRGDLVLVLPMLHPSALIRSGGVSSAKFPAFRARLQAAATLCAVARQTGAEGAADWLRQKGHVLAQCFGGKRQNGS